MVEALLRADAATRTFGDFTAVDSVSLEVGPGEVVGLLGANGAGKTTLLRMILGLLAPTSGAVELFGEAPTRASRARLGYVPQGRGLWEDLTIAENLAFVDAAFGSTPTPIPAALAASADTIVSGVGLGIQRRAAFAAALSHAPELLILDEPTSGVDPLSRARLWDSIHDSAESGLGVLVTTHYMQEAQQCDRLVLMSRGRAVAHGSEADIVAGVNVTAVETDDWHAAFFALADAGLLVALAGRAVRVVGARAEAVEKALAAAGIVAAARSVAATLDEAMAARERAA